MAKHLLFGLGGLVWNEQVGKLLHGEIGATPTTPTTTFVPTLICAGGAHPSIVLSVAGASGTVSWCGQTWNLPGESGLKKEVCPTVYVKTKTTGVTSFGQNPQFNFQHQWWATNANLSLWRIGTSAPTRVYYSSYLQTFVPAPPFVNCFNQLKLRNQFLTSTYFTDTKQFTYYGSFTGLAELNIILAEPRPSRNNYAITNAFFSSFTVQGITYTWARGTNW